MGYRMEPAAVHIAHVLEKLHFFQFFNFFIIDTAYRKKRRLHAFAAKKNYMARQFFCTQLTFFTYEALLMQIKLGIYGHLSPPHSGLPEYSRGMSPVVTLPRWEPHDRGPLGKDLVPFVTSS